MAPFPSLYYYMSFGVCVFAAVFGMRGLNGTGIPKELPLLCVTPYLLCASLHPSVRSSSVCLSSPPARPPLFPTALLLSNPAYHLFLATYAQPMGRPAFPPPNRVKPINTNGKEGAKLGFWVARLQARNILPTAISLLPTRGCCLSPSCSFPTMSVPSSSPSCLSYAWLVPFAQTMFKLQLCRFCDARTMGGVDGCLGAGLYKGLPCPTQRCSCL